MQRNIRNEIYMALGALIVISFALVFAILLSNSVQDGEVPETPATETIEGTEIIVLIETDTPEPTASDTETPTEASATGTETNTPGREASPSPTVLETENTVAPSPTDTETATLDIEPSLTMVRLGTTTSPESTNTARPQSTDIGGVSPTQPPSPTVASPDEPTRTPSSCQKPQGWTTYTVQAGNTLFLISLATDSTVDELRYVNCIENINNILVGTTLFVPRKPRQPISAPATSNHRNNLYTIGCADARTQITNLRVAQNMNGTFNVYGSAYRDDFWYYKIEVRPDWASVYNFFSSSEAPVTNGVLTTINPDVFGAGVYWIRLSVVNREAIIESDAVCEIPVIFG